MSLIPCGSPRRAVPSVFPILPAALAMLGIACGSEQPTPPPASAPNLVRYDNLVISTAPVGCLGG